MRVMRVSGSAQPFSLVLDQTPQPRPGRSELLIRVAAAGVITAELSWYPTSHRSNGEARRGAVPAHEFSGIVAAVGEDVGSLEVGREVYGMNDWYSDGAMAEYCIAPYFALAPKPRRLTHTEAASVPISALTAWQGLFDRARLQPGERILIHGGAGGVGIFAIQLAKLHGAHVTTTVSARNRDFVSSLGADHVIDYKKSRFEESAGEMDVVFDTVGGETLARSWGVLKPGGRMVTVVSEEANPTDPRVRKAFFIVEPIEKQLVEVADLLDRGKLRTFVDTVIPFAQAADAFSDKLERQGRGKLVIDIAKTNEEEVHDYADCKS